MSESIKDTVDRAYTSYSESLRGANELQDRFGRSFVQLIIEYNNKITYTQEQSRMKGIGRIITPFIDILFTGLNISKHGEVMEDYLHRDSFCERILEQDLREAETILNRLPFKDILDYFNDTRKHGLKKAYNNWYRRTIPIIPVKKVEGGKSVPKKAKAWFIPYEEKEEN